MIQRLGFIFCFLFVTRLNVKNNNNRTNYAIRFHVHRFKHRWVHRKVDGFSIRFIIHIVLEFQCVLCSILCACIQGQTIGKCKWSGPTGYSYSNQRRIFGSVDKEKYAQMFKCWRDCKTKSTISFHSNDFDDHETYDEGESFHLYYFWIYSKTNQIISINWYTFFEMFHIS